MSSPKKIIKINGQQFFTEKDTLSADEIRQFISAPSDYEVWKIIGQPDPEGQLPTDDLQITGSTEIHSGYHFRVVPSGTFGQF